MEKVPLTSLRTFLSMPFTWTLTPLRSFPSEVCVIFPVTEEPWAIADPSNPMRRKANK
jgi:hypothetical protein